MRFLFSAILILVSSCSSSTSTNSNTSTCETACEVGSTCSNGRCVAAPVPVPECVNFCEKQVVCSDGKTTSITGTVYAPNGELPIPNAYVYVPNGSTSYPYGLETFVDGVASVAGGACKCNVSGSPLVSTISNTDGTFTLDNVPAGSGIPVVIQVGRWRRVVTVDVNACETVTLVANQTRLPTRQSEGTTMDAIPLIAIATGVADALECVLRMMGVEDSQFTNAGGTGRIRFYVDNGATLGNQGETPSYRQLTASQEEIDQYDAVLFPCNAKAHDEPAADKARVLDVASNANAYVNKGGRVFFTDYSYAWLYNIQPSMQLPWPSTTVSSDVHTEWPYVSVTGQIDTTFPRGQAFADWLASVNALSDTNPPRIELSACYRNLSNPAAGLTGLPANRWIYAYQNNPQDAILRVTFDTPWGLPVEQQCGRVIYTAYHVTRMAGMGKFPKECSTTGFTVQEKVLAYDLFDLTSCVQPPPPDDY